MVSGGDPTTCLSTATDVSALAAERARLAKLDPAIDTPTHDEWTSSYKKFPLPSQPVRPLPPAVVVEGSRSFHEPWLDRNRLLWLERNPQQKGRTTLMLRDGNGCRELTPGPWNLRTRLHGFGGAAVAVAGDQAVVVNDADRCLWHLTLTDPPVARRLCCPGATAVGDGCMDARRQRWIGVLEHPDRDALVSVDLHSGAVLQLRAAADFCGYPALSPDGGMLLWLEWDLPAMPWQYTTLWLAAVAADGNLQTPHCLAGGDRAESLFQPQWLPDGGVVVSGDRSGYWNLLYHPPRTLGQARADWQPLLPMAAEFAVPQWQAGMSTTAATDQGLVAACCREGSWCLGQLLWPRNADAPPRWKPFDLPFNDFAGVRAAGCRAVCIAAGPRNGAGLLDLDVRTGRWQHTPASPCSMDQAHITVAQPRWFGGHGGQRTHGWVYRPSVAAATLPPLLLRPHSGPTAMARPALNLTTQFWTSRGWVVLDLNYGGSTGFGKAYRQRLDGEWGVVDVNDCIAAVEDLIREGRVDPRRIAIEGGSAGGFTALACLCSSNLFKAGACRYAVSDLATLARHTHRFESGYFDSLVGPWPQAADLYAARSPVQRAGGCTAAVVLFQGLADAVVPAEQTEQMAAALARRDGATVAVHRYPEEGHGFRDGAVQLDVLVRTEAFFRQHLGTP